KQNCFDVRRVRNHRDGELGGFCNISGRVAFLCASLEQRFLFNAAPAIQEELVTAPLQVKRHWRSHYSQTDKTDVCHNVLWRVIYSYLLSQLRLERVFFAGLYSPPTQLAYP